MIYELRTYTLSPGKQGEYLKLNSEVGRPIRGDKYGKLEGSWTTEFGTLKPVRPPLGLRGPRRARAAAGRTREERGVEQGLRLEDPPAAPRPGEQDPVRAAAPEAAGRRRAHLRAADLSHPGRQGRRVARPLQRHHAGAREILEERRPLPDRGRPAQRGRAPLGVSRPERPGGGAGQDPSRSRVAGLPRQGHAAARRDALDRARPGAVVSHEVTVRTSA